MKQFVLSGLLAIALIPLAGCASDQPTTTTTTTEETMVQHPAPVSTTTTETQRSY